MASASVTKNDRYSREFILKLIFVYGSHIEDNKQIGVKTWDELCCKARERRLNVDDVMKEKWEDVKIPINWWWKKYNSNSPKNREKNRRLHEEYLIEIES